MYRCRMKIAIFSKDTMLSELVRSLEPLEHFTHEITVAPEANQEIMRESRRKPRSYSAAAASA